KTAEEMGIWEGEAGVKNGLINEIHRLTNMAVSSDKGWEMVPLHTAITKKLIDEDTLAEVEGELIFFTLVTRMNKREQSKAILEVACNLWGSQITLLDITAYMSSLPTSTAAES